MLADCALVPGRIEPDHFLFRGHLHHPTAFWFARPHMARSHTAGWIFGFCLCDDVYAIEHVKKNRSGAFGRTIDCNPVCCNCHFLREQFPDSNLICRLQNEIQSPSLPPARFERQFYFRFNFLNYKIEFQAGFSRIRLKECFPISQNESVLLDPVEIC